MVFGSGISKPAYVTRHEHAVGGAAGSPATLSKGVSAHVRERVSAAGGAIGLVEEGDIIEIDIPNRRIHLVIEELALAARRAAMEARGANAWKPMNRQRAVSAALKAYAAMTTSADTGAVRDISQLS